MLIGSQVNGGISGSNEQGVDVISQRDRLQVRRWCAMRWVRARSSARLVRVVVKGMLYEEGKMPESQVAKDEAKLSAGECPRVG